MKAKDAIHLLSQYESEEEVIIQWFDCDFVMDIFKDEEAEFTTEKWLKIVALTDNYDVPCDMETVQMATLEVIGETNEENK